MAAIKYLDLAGLQVYDAQIKTKISEGDAKAIKNFTYDEATRVLKFYKAEEVKEDTVADFTMTLPDDVDTSGLLEKLEGATVGNVVAVGADGTVVDGGVALADLATKEEVEELAEGQVKANKEAIEKLNGNAETEGSVAKSVKDVSDAINATIGTVEDGKTVVGMIGEVADAVADAEEAGKVTISTDATTEGYLKTYTIKQGDTEVGKIDIAKDLVVTAGEVVVNPEGQPEGTYIKLTIANQEAPVFVNVKDLCDVYTAQGEAAQVQLAISDTNEISATIVAGSIGTTELADNAVVTAKIADGNVTRAKISAEFEAQIKALEDAIGEDGAVSEQIADAVAELDADVSSAEVEVGKGVRVQVVETDGKVTAVNVTGNFDSVYDTAGAANTAEVNAKKHADDLNTAMDTRVDALEELVGEGNEAISTDDITALFA